MDTHTSSATAGRTTPERIATGSWRIAEDRSRIGFRVRKMGVYYVKGRFRSIQGRVDFGPEGLPGRGEATIEAATITTRMPPRDWQLRTADFLDVERHPLIKFTAERVAPAMNGSFTVRGQFEIHGQRRPVELGGHLHAAGEQMALHLRGTLDRHDFGIRARQPIEMVIGDEVHLDVELGLEPTA
ncbi:MAG TPA: YceI family protein [Solirubrobacterales bacterium]|nr:YceI family protein [Solirubrobacterales bacterium]